MSNNYPYIEDFYACVECGQKAKYQCPNCGNLKLCELHAVKKAGKSHLYCFRCFFRLHPVDNLRFLGATKPLPKFNAVTKRKQKIRPKIYPKSDRERVFLDGKSTK